MHKSCDLNSQSTYNPWGDLGTYSNHLPAQLSMSAVQVSCSETFPAGPNTKKSATFQEREVFAAGVI